MAFGWLIGFTAFLTAAEAGAQAFRCAVVLKSERPEFRSDTPGGTVTASLRDTFLGDMGYYMPMPVASMTPEVRRHFENLLPMRGVGQVRMAAAPFTTTTTFLGFYGDSVPLFTVSHHADATSKPVEVHFEDGSGQMIRIPLAERAVFSSVPGDVSIWTVKADFGHTPEEQAVLARLKTVPRVRWTSKTIQQVVQEEPNAQFYMTGSVIYSVPQQNIEKNPDLWPRGSAEQWKNPAVAAEAQAQVNPGNNQSYVKFAMPFNNMVAESRPVIDPDAVRPGAPPPAPGTLRLGPNWQPETVLFNYRNFGGSSGSPIFVKTSKGVLVIATHWGLDPATDVRDLIAQVKGRPEDGVPSRPDLAYPEFAVTQVGGVTQYTILRDEYFGMAAVNKAFQDEAAAALGIGAVEVSPRETRALREFLDETSRR